MLTLAGWASVALIVIALVNLALLGGLVYLVFMVRKQLEQLRHQAQPVISEARSTLSTVRDVASDVGKRVETISERAEHVAARAEHVATEVTGRADHITANITRQVDMVSSDLTQRVEHVIDTSERLAERIMQRVDATTSVIEEAVARPMIGLASVRAGINKGLDAWRGFRGGDGRKEQEERDAESRRLIEETTPVTITAPREGESP